jgi:hypothetical protein
MLWSRHKIEFLEKTHVDYLRNRFWRKLLAEGDRLRKAAERFDAQGNLTDEDTKQYIRKLLQSLVEWTNRISVDRK